MSSFATAEEAATGSCLLFSDLTTWDIREMSFANELNADGTANPNAGYYNVVENGDYLLFNPCRQLNFDLEYTVSTNSDYNNYASISEYGVGLEYGTFGVFYDNADGSYTATQKDQWIADSIDALFEVDDEGKVVSKDDTIGVSVTYESETTCGTDSVLSLNFQVMCDENMAEPAEPLEGQVKEFVPAVIASSSLANCEKQIVFNHYTGCSEYSMLGFVNFLNENVWLSGTLLLIFGLCIGLFGQRWFLPITGAFAALCAFCAFMVLSSIFQWLNTTVGMIICTLFAIGCAGAAYWFGSRQRVASLLLCLGGGFMLGSIVEGLIIVLFSWESMVFYLIVTTGLMVGAGLLGCYHPQFVNRWLTATVGSYIFMRGWTYYLGGYPSEIEMYNMMAHPDSQPLDFNGLFWFYVALWVGGVFAFVYIQKSWAHAKAHEGDNYHK